jgi:SH3-like domain-containing protein
MKRWIAPLLLALALPAAAQDQPVPYWASIDSGQAMMRTGPARTYPGVWLYQRRDLPVRVLKRHESWRLVEDHEGTRGWFLVALLSAQRTALVRGSEPRPVHAQANQGSRVRYLAEPGAIGRIDNCAKGWCRIRFGQREGHIRVAYLWGVEPNEEVD